MCGDGGGSGDGGDGGYGGESICTPAYEAPGSPVGGAPPGGGIGVPSGDYVCSSDWP